MWNMRCVPVDIAQHSIEPGTDPAAWCEGMQLSAAKVGLHAVQALAHSSNRLEYGAIFGI
jgi:hypothetical protein